MDNNFFDRINDWIRGTETSIVNVISSFAPWLAPLAPSYMTFQHARDTLGFPFWLAATAASVVEILGFSTVSTFMAFWFFNKKNRAEKKRAPIALVVIAFLFYMALIILSNVLLDAFPNDRWVLIGVRGLFTMQTLPAAIIVAVRTQHRELIAEFARESAEAKTTAKYQPQQEQRPRTVPRVRSLPRRTNDPNEQRAPQPNERRADIFAEIDRVWASEQRIPGPSEIARNLGWDVNRAKGYISEKTGDWKRDRGLEPQPGNEPEVQQ